MVAVAHAAAGVGPDRDGERDAAVQPLAVAAERDERLEATGLAPPGREPRARPAGERLPPGEHPVGRLEVRAVVDPPRQLQPVAPQPGVACDRLEVRDLRLYAGSLRRASLSFPQRSKLAAFTLSTGSEWPGPRGDRLSLRSLRLIRLTDSARSLNSV